MTKALSWFSHQVSDQHPDFGEGRRSEIEIPHSDQWIDNADPKGNYRPDKFNRKAVLKERNPRSISRHLIEELYQGKESPDLHNAVYTAGRYLFSFPQAFTASHTEKRSVGVRRIQIIPQEYYFTLSIDGRGAIDVQIPSTYSLQEALSAMVLHWARQKKGTYLKFRYFENTVTMELHDSDDDSIVPCQIDKAHTTIGFFQLLNVPDDRIDLYFPSTDAGTFVFRQVWNRRDLFLHASFVSNTTAGYLGRSGEFYPKPSKIYPLADENTFSVELSFDGHRKVCLYHENFMLELVFILDTDSYIAE
jgi:hypothetical protein